ncbi:hypothetical protein [Consotaella salsifontis]|uniref:Uncharacterized protein n=1 Tax=Consotaella salsifontis TaxID=1365950 RepID=A0A1T4M8L0_9HYPH|nr:hypothetical protein [Consotaella salsifontis]SJZ63262.1 hypothetical protein SAMN05428963_10211 [Consotaella salsifontis]
MTDTTYTDLSMRNRAGSRSVLRVAFDRMVEARQRQADRYVAQLSEFNNGTAKRRSLFEGTAPERP